MPELPEVETTRRGIEPFVLKQKVQKVILRRDTLRWPIDQNLPVLLKGKTVETLSRRGKYLLFEFAHGTLLWHLGMSGNIRVVQKKHAVPVQKHDHIDIVFSSGDLIRYNDPRRFGAVLWAQAPVTEHVLLANLGPEPLTHEFNFEYLYQRSRKRNTKVKTWIMDSKVVVGVGNIYANESLFNAGIHPLKTTGKLTKKECYKLVDEIKKILTYAIQRGGTTLKDFVGGDGKPGYFAQELSVYGRAGEPCKKCKKLLVEKTVGQRTTVYCTRCQKR